MQNGLKNDFDCIKAFSETDFNEDLKKFEVPVIDLWNATVNQEGVENAYSSQSRK